jgi:hypothetical protein
LENILALAFCQFSYFEALTLGKSFCGDALVLIRGRAAAVVVASKAQALQL